MGQLLGLILLCSGMMSLYYAALLIKCADYVQIMLRLSNTTQVIPSMVITQVCEWALLEQEVMLATVQLLRLDKPPPCFV